MKKMFLVIFDQAINFHSDTLDFNPVTDICRPVVLSEPILASWLETVTYFVHPSSGYHT